MKHNAKLYSIDRYRTAWDLREEREFIEAPGMEDGEPLDEDLRGIESAEPDLSKEDPFASRRNDDYDPVRIYLVQMGKWAVLAKADEAILGARIMKGRLLEEKAGK